MHAFVAERVYSASNSSIGSNCRPNQRIIFIFIIVLVAVLRHFSQYTSQHSNANFQNSCNQYVLPREFLECLVRNVLPLPSAARGECLLAHVPLPLVSLY